MVTLHTDEVRRALATYLGCSTSQIALSWKGRVGFYGLLKSLGVGPSDEVILPAYTCVVVPNAVFYVGATPVYVDIDPLTYTLDPRLLEERISPRTRVIVAQNSYGLSADNDAILAVARKHGIKVIEDCTHGFGGRYKGRLNGTGVDAAFFSSQWNKVFSTGLGGFVVSNDQRLASAMAAFEEELSEPTRRDRWSLATQLTLRDRLGYSTSYWAALKLYRTLSSSNLILGSSSKEELRRTAMPPGYLKGFSPVQAKRALSALDRIDANLSHRACVAARYDELLITLGIAPPYRPDYATHMFTMYPLLVRNRATFLDRAERAGVPVHDWFRSPLHPIEEDLEPWGLETSQYPVATQLSKHVVNLLTDLRVNPRIEARIQEFVKAQRQELLEPSAVLN